MTAIGGSLYPIDIYKPIYGQPKPDGARSGTDFFEQVKSQALNLQDQIVFTDGLRGMVGVRLEHFEQSTDDFTRHAAKSRQTHNALTQRAGLLYQLRPQPVYSPTPQPRSNRTMAWMPAANPSSQKKVWVMKSASRASCSMTA